MHTYTQAHWRPPLFTCRCICMQTAHFKTIWSHSGGFARSVPSLGENIAGAEWKLHFAGANISLGLWKIPFKWSQAEKRQRICLAFCLTVFSAYTAVSFFLFFQMVQLTGGSWEHRCAGRAEGTHMMKLRTVWLSVCLSVSGCLSFCWRCLNLKQHVLHPCSFTWFLAQLLFQTILCHLLCVWWLSIGLHDIRKTCDMR